MMRTAQERPKAIKSKKLQCSITGHQLPENSVVALTSLRPSLAEFIIGRHPNLAAEDMISKSVVDECRLAFVKHILMKEHGELTDLDKEVALSLARHETIAENIENSYEQVRGIGDQLSDHLARFGGSWAFLLGFSIVLILWMTYNSFASASFAFDRYPFVFLNLVLSCLAAVQAPVILMSQRRAETKDRLRAASDYRVNLKAELEIRHLHEKMDHLISRQWQRLLEIQQLQLEALNDREHRAGF